MIDCVKNLVTSNTFCTVISGVLVFVICQLFNEYFLRPIHDYKKLRAKIAQSLILYANLYMNPIDYKSQDEKDERGTASIKLRELAAEVDAMIELLPLRRFMIKRNKILETVSKDLIGLSNNMYSPHLDIAIEQNEERRNDIYIQLKMKKK